MDEVRPDLRNKLGMIMSNYRIAPQIQSVSEYSKTEPPTVTWTINGSVDHPNNRFVVYFYDEDNNLLGCSDTIIVNGFHKDDYTYSVSTTVWQDVLNNLNYICGESFEINIAVAGYRYDFAHISDPSRMTSGPYFSSYIETTISNTHSVVYGQFNNEKHSVICTDCNDGTKYQNHEIKCIIENSSSHSFVCLDCGYCVSNTAHNFGYRGYSSTHHEKYCLDCGYVHSTERHSFRVDGAVGNYNRCIACGAMIYVGGDDLFPIQTIPPKDPEEETE